MPSSSSTLVAICVLTAIAGAKAAPIPASSGADQIVSDYLDGRWEQLETEMPAAKNAPGVTDAQRADFDLIRKSLLECRPEWWNTIKAGKKAAFRPVLWGRPLAATFDPQGKMSILLNYTGSQARVTLTWDASEMDNPSQAEHGFSKGDLSALGIWMNLGMAQSWMDVPLAQQANLNEAARLSLTRYLDLRANLAGAYYGTPRARRWGLWLDLAAWMDKYAKMPAVMSRKAMGSMFEVEVLSHPGRYPSLRLPEALPAAGAEARLAEALKSWIEKHGLTLAEDQALRDALKAFAAANANNVRQSGKVTLPNGLFVSLDPDADKPESEKRDAWIKAHLPAKPEK